MAIIIPAILESDINELQHKLDLIADLVIWAQIDLMDGQFVANKSIKPEELTKIHSHLNLEAHLMVQQPEKWLDYLPNDIIKRVFFHIEATEEPDKLIDKIRAKGFEVGVAINLETPPIETISQYIDRIDYVLFMSIKPGWQGQALQEIVLEKIKQFKIQYPKQTVSIDGGVNMTNIFKVAKAGVDNISVGSAIFSNGDIAENLLKLKDQLT